LRVAPGEQLLPWVLMLCTPGCGLVRSHQAQPRCTTTVQEWRHPRVARAAAAAPQPGCPPCHALGPHTLFVLRRHGPPCAASGCRRAGRRRARCPAPPLHVPTLPAHWPCCTTSAGTWRWRARAPPPLPGCPKRRAGRSGCSSRLGFFSLPGATITPTPQARAHTQQQYTPTRPARLPLAATRASIPAGSFNLPTHSAACPLRWFCSKRFLVASCTCTPACRCLRCTRAGPGGARSCQTDPHLPFLCTNIPPATWLTP